MTQGIARDRADRLRARRTSPLGVYLLTVRNHAATPRRLRLAPYFQMVLAGQPEYSGPLQIRADRSLGALFFENPRNTFRTGPAFVAISGRPIGSRPTGAASSGPAATSPIPTLVEHGEPDDRHGPTTTGRSPRSSTTLDLPAHGEGTVVVLLGQADDRARAEAVIRKYREPGRRARRPRGDPALVARA